MDLYAAAMLIPVGVMFYTAHGGLRASYLAAWANTGTIFIALVIFVFMVYASGIYPIGSISSVWSNLNIMADVVPVAGNRSAATSLGADPAQDRAWSRVAVHRGTNYATRACVCSACVQHRSLPPAVQGLGLPP